MCISTIARATYHIRSKPMRSLWLCIALLILGGSSALGQTSGLPLQEVRTIYPGESGALNQASVTYSTELAQLFVLQQDTSGDSTIVALTPYEDVVDSVPLNFNVDSAANIAFDDTEDRLFLLDSQQATLSQLALGADDHLDPATLTHFDVSHLGLNQATGMDVDVKNGNLLILDSNNQRIVRVTLSADFDPARADFSAIDLAHLSLAQTHGLAVNPAGSHIFIVEKDGDSLTLYELTPAGQVVATYDPTALNLVQLRDIDFGPSADMTDAADMMHLFIAASKRQARQASDSALGTNQLYLPLIAQLDEAIGVAEVDAGIATGNSSNGAIIEVTLTGKGQSTRAASVNTTQITLVQTVDMSDFSPPSPDSAGIGYNSTLDRLLISDSEVNEISKLFTGDNLFEVRLDGTLARTGTTILELDDEYYADEPTGVAFNPTNGHLFIADDTSGGGKGVFEVDPGADNQYGSSDDIVLNYINSKDFGSNDPEGVTFDTSTGHLYMVDGVNKEVYRLNPANGNVVANFDTNRLDIDDPEGIHYDAASGNLIIVGKSEDELYEVTTTGSLVSVFDTSAANATRPAGVTMAPSSSNPNRTSFYMVDRGVDNNDSSSQNDGRIYEFMLPAPAGAAPTATINAPTSGATFNQGDTISFSGSGSDPEDGDVTASLTWTSNLDGTIGSDGSFTRADLTPGQHTITATATDSSGRTNSDQINITIDAVNQRPTVDAGADQTIEIGSGATLDGTVTDDGLPNPPSAVTSTWSQVSGPGSATFANASTVDTIVTFPAIGTYVLRLTADDSALTSSDEVTITVTPPNTLPTAAIAAPTAGATFTQGDTITFTGSGTDTEDGDVTASLVWTSNIDGTIGNGGSFSRSNLSSGVHTVTATATDSHGAISSAQIVFTINTPAGTLTLDVRVAAGADDAEERVSGGVSLSSSDLEFTFDKGGHQTVGMRFNGINLPPGATIVNAYLQFQADETNSGATSLTIQGEAVDNAAVFTTVAGNVSARPRTSAAVSWSPPDWTVKNEIGPKQQTPNIAAVIREIVGRSGWSSGNSLAIIITGTGERTADSFNGNPAGAPLLHIEYVSGPRPPTANAGPDQTVILPASATLNGSVSDDGLPNPPGTVTATWSQVSGPGTVTFADANAVDTTASFSAGGTYVLRLTADDGDQTASDDVTITVTNGLPPTADAGPDQTVVLPASATLDGTVSDDGLPNPPGAVTATWSQVSGPGAVTFADANAADTTATFAVGGTYVLRLTADDGEQTASDDVTIIVTGGGGQITVEVRVASSTDDAEERSDGGVSLSSSDLEFTFDRGGNQTVGMRFNGTNLPQGATILNAYIQFQADEVNTGATSLTIQGEAVDNATTFTSAVGSISARPPTSAAVSWSPPPWTVKNEIGSAQQTPDIAAVIQEIVNRPGWSSSNSLVIIITGTGERTADSFNGNPAGAPLLHVAYQ